MCIDMCVDMCVDMCIHMCIGMCIDMCIGKCIDMCIVMCIDICVYMCIDMCMCIGMCVDSLSLRSVSTFFRFAHVHTHVYAHGFIRVCAHTSYLYACRYFDTSSITAYYPIATGRTTLSAATRTRTVPRGCRS